MSLQADDGLDPPRVPGMPVPTAARAPRPETRFVATGQFPSLEAYSAAVAVHSPGLQGLVDARRDGEDSDSENERRPASKRRHTDDDAGDTTDNHPASVLETARVVDELVNTSALEEGLTAFLRNGGIRSMSSPSLLCSAILEACPSVVFTNGQSDLNEAWAQLFADCCESMIAALLKMISASDTAPALDMFNAPHRAFQRFFSRLTQDQRADMAGVSNTVCADPARWRLNVSSSVKDIVAGARQNVFLMDALTSQVFLMSSLKQFFCDALLSCNAAIQTPASSDLLESKLMQVSSTIGAAVRSMPVATGLSVVSEPLSLRPAPNPANAVRGADSQGNARLRQSSQLQESLLQPYSLHDSRDGIRGGGGNVGGKVLLPENTRGSDDVCRPKSRVSFAADDDRGITNDPRADPLCGASELWDPRTHITPAKVSRVVEIYSASWFNPEGEGTPMPLIVWKAGATLVHSCSSLSGDLFSHQLGGLSEENLTNDLSLLGGSFSKDQQDLLGSKSASSGAGLYALCYMANSAIAFMATENTNFRASCPMVVNLLFGGNLNRTKGAALEELLSSDEAPVTLETAPGFLPPMGASLHSLFHKKKGVGKGITFAPLSNEGDLLRALQTLVSLSAPFAPVAVSQAFRDLTRWTHGAISSLNGDWELLSSCFIAVTSEWSTLVEHWVTSPWDPALHPFPTIAMALSTPRAKRAWERGSHIRDLRYFRSSDVLSPQGALTGVQGGGAGFNASGLPVAAPGVSTGAPKRKRGGKKGLPDNGPVSPAFPDGFPPAGPSPGMAAGSERPVSKLNSWIALSKGGDFPQNASPCFGWCLCPKCKKGMSCQFAHPSVAKVKGDSKLVLLAKRMREQGFTPHSDSAFGLAGL